MVEFYYIHVLTLFATDPEFKKIILLIIISRIELTDPH